MGKRAIFTTVYPEGKRTVTRCDEQESLVTVWVDDESGGYSLTLRVGRNGSVTLRLNDQETPQAGVFAARILHPCRGQLDVTAYGAAETFAHGPHRDPLRDRAERT